MEFGFPARNQDSALKFFACFKPGVNTKKDFLASNIIKLKTKSKIPETSLRQFQTGLGAAELQVSLLHQA